MNKKGIVKTTIFGGATAVETTAAIRSFTKKGSTKVDKALGVGHGLVAGYMGYKTGKEIKSLVTAYKQANTTKIESDKPNVVDLDKDDNDDDEKHHGLFKKRKNK